MNELYRRWLLSKEAYLKGTDAMGKDINWFSYFR